jgi:hypothetical protein
MIVNKYYVLSFVTSLFNRQPNWRSDISDGHFQIYAKYLKKRANNYEQNLLPITIVENETIQEAEKLVNIKIFLFKLYFFKSDPKQ